MKKNILLLPMLLLVSCTQQEPFGEFNSIPTPIEQAAISDEVTTSDLARLANSFMNKHNESTRSNGFSISTVYNSSGQPALYVINFTGNRGFIITSATKRMMPILAYSETGNYNINGKNPEGLKSWQTETVKAIETAIALPLDSTKAYRMMWRQYEEPASFVPISSSTNSSYYPEFQAAQAIMQDSMMSWINKGYEIYSMEDDITGDPAKNEEIRETVYGGIDPRLMDYWDILSFAVYREDPYVETVDNFVYSTWDQVDGYDDAFPPIGDREHAYAGCGPVAVGQVMRYYQYPPYFNWSAMPLNAPSRTTSNFLYDIAETSDATYKESGTETYIDKLCSTLKIFGYNDNMEYAAHDAQRTWQLIEQQIPVIMSGSTNSLSNGHAWIATGGKYVRPRTVLEVYTFANLQQYLPIIREYEDFPYPTYYFYMNWGWNGYSNGFFADSYLCVPGYPVATNRTNIYDITY